MRGVGGPLLCIGDLLADLDQQSNGGDVVVSVDPTRHHQQPTSPPPISSNFDHVHPSHLPKLFEFRLPFFTDNYDQLNKALAGTDHSWTALTLKLCTALETANNLIQSTNSHAGVLSEKVGKLEKMISRRDSAIAQVKAIQDSLKHSGEALPEENR